ncbi:MAG: hypothetical protein IJ488_05560 [Clostridia bacterium]|nr:hypothetical protein [Clostridia bacterium]
MKNRKTAKLLIMILSLALLIGSAVGIAASAENAAPEIISQNVEYSGTLNFKFAISAENLGADKTVTVNIYDKNPEEDGAVLLDSTTAEYQDVSDTNLGVQYAYVATSKAAISALNYGTEYYAQAVCDDVAGEAVKYSAVEYFLTRLYREGETVTPIQREHYENVLAYGSTTQKITGDTGTNVADFVFVAAQDGKVNGKDSVVVEKGTEVTLTYTGENSGFAYYLDAAGNKLGRTAAVSASGTYTAKFADFAFNDLSTAATFTPSTITSTGLKSVAVADGDKDVSKYAGLLYGNIGNTTDGRSYSFSITDDGRLKYASPKGGTAIGFVNSKNYESGHNYSVFEADIQIDLGKSASTGNQLTNCMMTCDLMQTSSNTMYRFVMNYKATNGGLEMYFQRNKAYTGVTYKDTSHVTAFIANANDYSVSYKFKIEQYYITATADTVCIISINDKPFMIADTRAIGYEGDCPTSDADVTQWTNSDGVYVIPFAHYTASNTDDTPNFATSFRGFTINPNSGYVCDLYFDNIIYEASVVENVPTFNIAKPE